MLRIVGHDRHFSQVKSKCIVGYDPNDIQAWYLYKYRRVVLEYNSSVTIKVECEICLGVNTYTYL